MPLTLAVALSVALPTALASAESAAAAEVPAKAAPFSPFAEARGLLPAGLLPTVLIAGAGAGASAVVLAGLLEGLAPAAGKEALASEPNGPCAEGSAAALAAPSDGEELTADLCEAEDLLVATSLGSSEEEDLATVPAPSCEEEEELAARPAGLLVKLCGRALTAEDEELAPAPADLSTGLLAEAPVSDEDKEEPALSSALLTITPDGLLCCLGCLDAFSSAVVGRLTPFLVGCPLALALKGSL